MILKFFIVSVLLGYSCTSAFLKGKPLVNITRLYPCEEVENKVIVAGANVSPYNKTTQLISGFFTFNEPWDKSYKVRAVVSRLIDNKWHKDIHLEKDDPCTSLRMMFGPLYSKLLKVGHVGRCPVQPGTYSVTDFPIDAQSIPLIYATGLFKLDGYFIKKKNSEIKFCYHVEAMIDLE